MGETPDKDLKKAQAAYQSGDYAAAIAAYTEAILSLPSDPELYYERGLSHYHDRGLVASLKDLDKAASLEPANPFRYSSRAYIKGKLGMIEEAIADYERTIDLDPEDAVAHNNLGLMQEQLGYQKKAKNHFSKADALAPDLFAHSELATSNERQEIDQLTSDLIDSVNSERTHAPRAQDYVRVVKDLFTKRKTFKELTRFVRRGLKTIKQA